VVLVFPGQGGAYKGMGLALAKAGLLGPGIATALVGTTAAPWSSAEAIVAASLAAADAITNHLSGGPLKVCAVLGHSLGEWAAAAFVGVVARVKALALARQRNVLVAALNRTLEFQQPNGGVAVMVAVRAAAAALAEGAL
jgi:malonyl CoA-acyl carrier protein transacylase